MSRAIRAILVDHARAANKRGGDMISVTFTDADVGEETIASELLAMEQVPPQLEALDPHAGQVMHLAYFGGLKQEQIAALRDISIPPVKRDIRFARAWLTKALVSDAAGVAWLNIPEHSPSRRTCPCT